jgi:hypothetical protein
VPLRRRERREARVLEEDDRVPGVEGEQLDAGEQGVQAQSSSSMERYGSLCAKATASQVTCPL